MELDPESLGVADRYGLLISVIQPRPIAWVSTVGPDGTPNLAPFSFFTGITAKPMTLVIAPTNTREGRRKDTLINAEATRQFVVNIANQALAEKMNQTSADWPYGVSEFAKAGLTQVPSVKVKPPRVKGSPVSLECELHQVVTISDGPLGGHLVIGRVVHVHVEDSIWKDGRVSHKDLKAIGRLEGAWYTRVTDTFQMERPRIQKEAA